MNEKMWLHPAVQANAERLRGWGHLFLGPETGAFGTPGEGSGTGRMAEPEAIAARALAFLGGIALLVAALITTVSVGLRWATSQPIRGDFEMVSIASGVADCVIALGFEQMKPGVQ